MKASFSIILLFFVIGCNNNSTGPPEEKTDTAQVVGQNDTTVMAPGDEWLSSQPIPGTEEKLLANLQKIDKEKIDSISAEDILETVKDILEALHEESENDDWEKAKEHFERTESTMKQSKKGRDIFNENNADFTKIKGKIETRRLEQLEADKYLKEISSKSRWESIRKSFQRKLTNGELSEFSSEQENVYEQILSDWNDYKENNKLSWYRNGGNDLEELFFDYSKGNGKVKAAWGFMIQQVDWDGAVNYYTNIAPDAKATGQPSYMLNYYYNTIGKGSQSMQLYDQPTNEWVGHLCPPEH